MQIELAQHSEMQSSISNRVNRAAIEASLTTHCKRTRSNKQRKCAQAFFTLCDAFQVYRTEAQQANRIPTPNWL